jgi:hypothetical protein
MLSDELSQIAATLTSPSPDYQAIQTYLGPSIGTRAASFDTPSWAGPDSGGGPAQAFDIADGSVGTDQVADNAIGIGQMDNIAPAVPTNLALTSTVVAMDAGPLPTLVASLTQPADTDLVGCWVELTCIVTGGNPDWTNPERGFVGREDATVQWVNVLPLTTYYARARSFDVAGNLSAYTGVVSTTSSADAIAPATPGHFVAIPGYRALGCAWDFVLDPDLDYYELQSAPEDPASPGNPNTGMWMPVRVGKSTEHRITDLDPALPWFVQVRAVDTSGNASAWSASASGTPLLIGYNDITAAVAVIDLLRTGQLVAGSVVGGSFTVKTVGGVTGIYVRDQDAPVLALGEWTPSGLIIRDPADRTRRWLKLNSGSLIMVNDGATERISITPDGIDAASINSGKGLQGAANVVTNSSVELAPALATTLLTKTTKADWDAAETAVDNCTHTAGGSLTVTAW